MKSIRRQLLVGLLAARCSSPAASRRWRVLQGAAGRPASCSIISCGRWRSRARQTARRTDVIEPPPRFRLRDPDLERRWLCASTIRGRASAAAITRRGYASVETPEGRGASTRCRRGVSVQSRAADAYATSRGAGGVAHAAALSPAPAAARGARVACGHAGLKPLERSRKRSGRAARHRSTPLPAARAEGSEAVVRRSTTCSRGLRARSRCSALSWRMPRTSCARRSPRCDCRFQLARASPDEASAPRVRALKQGLDRATHLVEQLLTLARQEPSAQAPARATSISARRGRSRGRCTHRSPRKSGIDLGLARRDTDVIVRGEREALRTLLSNLVDNALRYTPAGGRVDVSCAAGRGQCRARGDRHRARHTARGARARFRSLLPGSGTDAPGSGLGLAIVSSIAERHGASRAQDSPDGAGLRAVRVRAHVGCAFKVA